MFSLIRGLFLLALLLVGIGIYRGWFSLTGANRDPLTNQVNISVSVDANKMKADAQKVKAKLAEEVAQRVKQLDDPNNAPAVK